MIICYVRPDNTYYYKIVKGTYTNYFIGYENQYHHKVIMIIELPTTKRVYIFSIRHYIRRFLWYLYKKI